MAVIKVKRPAVQTQTETVTQTPAPSLSSPLQGGFRQTNTQTPAKTMRPAVIRQRETNPMAAPVTTESMFNDMKMFAASGNYVGANNVLTQYKAQVGDKNSPVYQPQYTYWDEVNGDEQKTLAAESDLLDMYNAVTDAVGKGYSDSWIKSNINKNNYPGLAALTKDTVLTRRVDYLGDDTINAMLYAARNDDKYAGDILTSMAMYYFGDGNAYMPDYKSEAARDPYSDIYHPYMQGNHATGEVAEANTAEAKKELAQFQANAIERLKAGESVDKIYDSMFENRATGLKAKYPTLFAMEYARTNKSAIDLTEDVDFAGPYVKEWLKAQEAEIQGTDQNMSPAEMLANQSATFKANIPEMYREIVMSMFVNDKGMKSENEARMYTVQDFDKWLAEYGLDKAADNFEDAFGAAVSKYSEKLALTTEANTNFDPAAFISSAGETADEETNKAQVSFRLGMMSYRSGMPVVDSNAKAFTEQYGFLFNNYNRNTGEVFLGPQGATKEARLSSHMQQSREKILGKEIDAKLDELDDALRNGAISDEGYYDCYLEIAAIYDTYNEPGSKDSFATFLDKTPGGDGSYYLKEGIIAKIDDSIAAGKAEHDAYVAATKERVSQNYSDWIRRENNGEEITDRDFVDVKSIDIDLKAKTSYTSDEYDWDYDQARNFALHSDLTPADRAQYSDIEKAYNNGYDTLIANDVAAKVDDIERLAIYLDVGFAEAAKMMGIDDITSYVYDQGQIIHRDAEKILENMYGVAQLLISNPDMMKAEDLLNSGLITRQQYDDFRSALGDDTNMYNNFYIRVKMAKDHGRDASGAADTYKEALAQRYPASDTAYGYSSNLLSIIGKGVKSGLIIHGNSWATALLGWNEGDAQQIENRARYEYDNDPAKYRQALRESIEFNYGDNPVVRDTYLNQLDNYTGDIFKFGFNTNQVVQSLYSVQRDTAEKLQALNTEMRAYLSKGAYEWYQTVGVATNSMALSAEALLLAKMLGAGGMNPQTAAFLGQMFTTGVVEGGGAAFELKQNGVSAGKAKAAGALIGTATALSEMWLEGVINKAAFSTGLAKSIKSIGRVNTAARMMQLSNALNAHGVGKGLKSLLTVSAKGVMGGYNFLLQRLIGGTFEGLQEAQQDLTADAIKYLFTGDESYIKSSEEYSKVVWDTFKSGLVQELNPVSVGRGAVDFVNTQILQNNFSTNALGVASDFANMGKSEIGAAQAEVDTIKQGIAAATSAREGAMNTLKAMNIDALVEQEAVKLMVEPAFELNNSDEAKAMYSLEAETEGLQAELEENQNRRPSIESLVVEMQTDVDNGNLSKDALGRVNEATKMLRSLDVTIDRQKTELDEKTARLADLKQEHEAKRKAIADQAKADAYKAVVDETMREAETNAKNAIEQATKNIADFQEKLKAAESDLNNVITKYRADFKRFANAMRNKADTYNTRGEELGLEEAPISDKLVETAIGIADILSKIDPVQMGQEEQSRKASLLKQIEMSFPGYTARYESLGKGNHGRIVMDGGEGIIILNRDATTWELMNGELGYELVKMAEQSGIEDYHELYKAVTDAVYGSQSEVDAQINSTVDSIVNETGMFDPTETVMAARDEVFSRALSRLLSGEFMGKNWIQTLSKRAPQLANNVFDWMAMRSKEFKALARHTDAKTKAQYNEFAKVLQQFSDTLFRNTREGFNGGQETIDTTPIDVNENTDEITVEGVKAEVAELEQPTQTAPEANRDEQRDAKAADLRSRIERLQRDWDADNNTLAVDENQHDSFDLQMLDVGQRIQNGELTQEEAANEMIRLEHERHDASVRLSDTEAKIKDLQSKLDRLEHEEPATTEGVVEETTTTEEQAAPAEETPAPAPETPAPAETLSPEEEAELRAELEKLREEYKALGEQWDVKWEKLNKAVERAYKKMVEAGKDENADKYTSADLERFETNYIKARAKFDKAWNLNDTEMADRRDRIAELEARLEHPEPATVATEEVTPATEEAAPTVEETATTTEETEEVEPLNMTEDERLARISELEQANAALEHRIARLQDILQQHYNAYGVEWEAESQFMDEVNGPNRRRVYAHDMQRRMGAIERVRELQAELKQNDAELAWLKGERKNKNVETTIPATEEIVETPAETVTTEEAPTTEETTEQTAEETTEEVATEEAPAEEQPAQTEEMTEEQIAARKIMVDAINKSLDTIATLDKPARISALKNIHDLIQNTIKGKRARIADNTTNTPVTLLRNALNKLGATVYEKVGAPTQVDAIVENEGVSLYDGADASLPNTSPSRLDSNVGALETTRRLSTDDIGSLIYTLGAHVLNVMEQQAAEGTKLDLTNSDRQTNEDLFAEWMRGLINNFGTTPEVDEFANKLTIDLGKTVNGRAMLKVLNETRDKLSKWYNADAMRKVGAYVRTLKENEASGQTSGRTKTKAYWLGSDIYADPIDDMTGYRTSLRKFVRYIPYAKGMVNSWVGDSDASHGFRDFQGHVLDGVMNLHDSIRAPYGKIYFDTHRAWIRDNLGKLLMIDTSLDRIAAGQNPFSTETENNDAANYLKVNGTLNAETLAAAKEQLLAIDPKLEQAAENVREWWRNVLQMAVKSGQMTQEQYNKFQAKNPNYAPLQRDMSARVAGTYGEDTDKGITLKVGGDVIDETTGLRFYRAKGGSNRAVINPLISFADQAQAIGNAIIRNNVAQEFVRAYDIAPSDMIGMFAKEVTNEQADEMSEHGQNILNVFYGGDSHRSFVFNNKELFDLLADKQDNKSFGRIIRFIGGVTRAMASLTTTNNPLFAIRNVIRDYQMSVDTGSWAATRLSGIPKWIVAFGESLAYTLSKSVNEVFNNSNEGFFTSDRMKDFINLGGEGFSRRDIARADKASTLNSIVGDNFFVRAVEGGKNLITVNSLQEAIEMASRYVEYRYGKNETRDSKGATDQSKFNAFMASREVTVDFAQAGNGTGARLMRKVIPFFNATLQGWYKTGRMFTEAERKRLPARVAKSAINNLVSGALSAGACLLGNALGVGDPEDWLEQALEYLKLSDDLKKDYIILPLTGWGIISPRDFIRVPLTQDMFGKAWFNAGRTAVESVYRVSQGEEDVLSPIALDMFNFVTETLLEPFTRDPVWQPFVDIARNRTYYGTNAVSETLRSRYPDAPTKWANQTTSEAFIYTSNAIRKILHALYLDKIIPNIPLLGGKEGYDMVTSPAGLEYIAKELTGVFGQLIIPAISRDKYSGENVGFQESFGNTLLNSFTTDAESTNDLSKNYSKAKDTLTSVSNLTEYDQDISPLPTLLSSDERYEAVEDARKMLEAFDEIDSTISDLWNDYNRVMQDDSLSEDERDKQAEALRKQVDIERHKGIDLEADYEKRWGIDLGWFADLTSGWDITSQTLDDSGPGIGAPSNSGLVEDETTQPTTTPEVTTQPTTTPTPAPTPKPTTTPQPQPNPTPPPTSADYTGERVRGARADYTLPSDQKGAHNVYDLGIRSRPNDPTIDIDGKGQRVKERQAMQDSLSNESVNTGFREPRGIGKTVSRQTTQPTQSTQSTSAMTANNLGSRVTDYNSVYSWNRRNGKNDHNVSRYIRQLYNGVMPESFFTDTEKYMSQNKKSTKLVPVPNDKYSYDSVDYSVADYPGAQADVFNWYTDYMVDAYNKLLNDPVYTGGSDDEKFQLFTDMDSQANTYAKNRFMLNYVTAKTNGIANNTSARTLDVAMNLSTNYSAATNEDIIREVYGRSLPESWYEDWRKAWNTDKKTALLPFPSGTITISNTKYYVSDYAGAATDLMNWYADKYVSLYNEKVKTSAYINGDAKARAKILEGLDSKATDWAKTLFQTKYLG